MSFLHFCTNVIADGLPPLSDAQKVYIRVVFDREQPAALEEPDRAIARQLFGDIDTIPDAARHVVCTLKGARVGGTMLHSVFLLYSALTTPLEGLAVGEVGFGAVVAPDLRLATQAFRYTIGAAESVEEIDRCVENKTTTSLTLRRPDGRVVTIECLPASRGGSAVRGRTYFAVLLDESSFFRDETSGQVNDAELYRAIAPRVLPGGLLAVISTVWGDVGLLWDKVQAEWGAPKSCLAVKAPSLTMRSDERMKQIVAEEYERDESNAAREFDLQPLGSGAGSFFATESINDAVSDRLRTPIPKGVLARVGAGCDTALISDSSAIVIVHLENGIFTVAETLELRPERGRPLKLSEVCASYAEVLKRHGSNTCMADHHELEASREYLRPLGVSLVAAPGSNQGKYDAYLLFRKLLVEGKIRIPANENRMVRQLKEVRSRPMPGGTIKITSPRKVGHGDILSALILAVYQLAGKGTNAMMNLLLERANRPPETHQTNGYTVREIG
jgi:hypothetical protein